MPQESRGRRRSFGYRSFITCEDPRGVVESGTIRKPKHGKKLVESERSKHRNLSTVEDEQAQSPTSFRLLEVSRGAQNLNNVISSWSDGHSRNNSREIAQDLLKGALDLGESLAMLSRLQESSNHISESTRNQQRHKIEKGSFEDIKKVILDEDIKNEKKNKKTKRSNLIAKLMGLEDASLRSLSCNATKYDHMGKGEKILNEEKTGFDLDPDEFSDSKRRWSASVSDDRPPIVILKPLTFSYVDLEQPIIPKSRAEVFEEMFVGMSIRTNPLAQTDECEPLNSAKEVKPKEMTPSPGKSRPHKKQLVDRNAQEPILKLKTSKGGDNRKLSMLESANAKYGRRGTKNWPEKMPRVVNKNGDQSCRDEYEEIDINRRRESLKLLSDSARITEDASQIEITVADYDDYDQSSPSETPVLFGNQRSKASAMTIMNECGGIDQDQGSHGSTIIRPNRGGNVCSKDNHSLSSRVTATVYATSTPCIDKLKALLLSNQPFIRRVEALFGLKMNQDTYLLHQVDNNVDHNDVNARELLDTANELVGIHGFQCSRTCPPLPFSAFKTSSITRYHYSNLEQLLDEVCEEIEALRCNRKDEGDDHSTETLVMLVKGDLRSTGMIGGMWDMGWMSAGFAYQIEEITRGVDELLLDGLIQEILVDFSL